MGALYTFHDDDSDITRTKHTFEKKFPMLIK